MLEFKQEIFLRCVITIVHSYFLSMKYNLYEMRTMKIALQMIWRQGQGIKIKHKTKQLTT